MVVLTLLLSKQCIFRSPLWRLQARLAHDSFKRVNLPAAARWKAPSKQGPGNIIPRRENAVSLLDELFPELANQDARASTPKPEREIPRLSLRSGQVASEGRPDKDKSRSSLLDEDRTVLVMQSACKSLNESDFRRLVPKSKHLEGWRGTGDFEKVIPARDPETLRLLGYYFLIFSTPFAAKAYQENVAHIHRIASTYSPRSLQSPIPPPPGMLVDGEDVHSVIQSYTLAPPGNHLRLTMAMRPYPSDVRQVFENCGYDRILSRPDRSEHEVLLSFEGEKQPTAYSVQRALGMDGTARGRSWDFAGGWPPKITRLDMPGRFREEDGGDDLSDDDNYGSGADDLRHLGSSDKRKRGVPKWIIPFQSDAEAKRFARSWHRRLFPTPDLAEYDDNPPLMHAEVLW